MSVVCGLDRLLAESDRVAGRRYGLLAHAASVTGRLVPAHLALLAAGVPPQRLFAPEHGFHGVEQDMVVARESREPWSDLPIVSLYGDDVTSLRPRPEAFAELDLLVIDLQDVGSRYYTYAASAVWAAEVAIEAGCQVWVLDRPNPLGGDRIEGNLPQDGLESFVGAFRIPVRHALTMGELVQLEALRRRWSRSPEVWPVEGWRRSMRWAETGLAWVAPSPNMPTVATAEVYPGLCLFEATELSEGRGTTRPFLLVGAPGIDGLELVRRLDGRALPGVRFLPAFFRPQFQKHSDQLCGGIEIVVVDSTALRPYRLGVELLEVFREVAPQRCGWREEPYEFVGDRPAIDLLTGDPCCRRGLEQGRGLESWMASWERDEVAFREECEEVLIYR